MYWENWKTIDNNPRLHTESENPILKKDEHHAEIIDITDGLVVEEQSLTMPDYKLDNYEIMKNDDIWSAFGNKKI